jgi:hypothetical protein
MGVISGQIRYDQWKFEGSEIVPATDCAITHSQSNFVFVFGLLDPLPTGPTMQVKARIMMSPQSAKTILKTLQGNIEHYEKQFGTIVLTLGKPVEE